MIKRPVPGLRWWIAGLLCLSTSLNYLDRQALSIPVVSWIALQWGWQWAFVIVSLTVGNLAGGAIPRLLVARGWSVDRARKTVMASISLLLMPVSCLLVHLLVPRLGVVREL